MKSYEVFERDIKNTKFGGRFYLKGKQVEGKHTFVPDDELKEELEALGLHAFELWVELEHVGISIIAYVDLVDEPMFAVYGSVFKILNSNSASEILFNLMAFGATEAEYLDEREMSDEACHCHEHEEPILPPKNSSKKAPKVS